MMVKMSEKQSCQSQIDVTVFWGLRVKHQKWVKIGNSMPILQGGGAGSHPTPNNVIRKRTVNTTLAMCPQADPAHC
jgi:hypothetical protein